jgi:hypothetical protein
MSLPFRKLALGAGGIKGILHIGALQELQKHQPLQFPHGIYGCSIGSIIATYISFNIPINDHTIELTKKYLSIEKIIPKPSFQDIKNAFSEKGLFSMDMFEQNITEMFLEVGISLENKTIGDAHQPLYIIASNITKGVPTIFSKDVPILDALKCSCCLPGVFKPQNLYGQLYVDGGVLVPCISWIQPDALTFSLTKQVISKLTPETISSISPLDYMKDMYALAVNHFMTLHKNENIVELSYPNLTSDSDLEDFDILDILNTSQESMRRFLTSKSFFQELPEISDSGSTNHLV